MTPNISWSTKAKNPEKNEHYYYETKPKKEGRSLTLFLLETEFHFVSERLKCPLEIRLLSEHSHP